MSVSLFFNHSSHSLGWWHHCLSATHVGSLLWPVLGASRHPWVWLLFHRSLAGELRQVCIPDKNSKVMTDILVWDTLDIYFSAMSDLAAPVSSRPWTCFSAISSYIQNGDSTAISSPCSLTFSGLIQRNICEMAYPSAACADWLIGCSRHPVNSLLVGVQVHRPLRICVRGPQYCLCSLVCSKVLTNLGAGSYAGLLLIHAGL